MALESALKFPFSNTFFPRCLQTVRTLVTTSKQERGWLMRGMFQIGLEKTQASPSVARGNVEEKFFVVEARGKRQKEGGGLKIRVPMEAARVPKNHGTQEIKWVEITRSQHEAGALIKEKADDGAKEFERECQPRRKKTCCHRSQRVHDGNSKGFGPMFKKASTSGCT